MTGRSGDGTHSLFCTNHADRRAPMVDRHRDRRLPIPLRDLPHRGFFDELDLRRIAEGLDGRGFHLKLGFERPEPHGRFVATFFGLRDVVALARGPLGLSRARSRGHPPRAVDERSQSR
jgi:hypothetical protein